MQSGDILVQAGLPMRVRCSLCGSGKNFARRFVEDLFACGAKMCGEWRSRLVSAWKQALCADLRRIAKICLKHPEVHERWFENVLAKPHWRFGACFPFAGGRAWLRERSLDIAMEVPACADGADDCGHPSRRELSAGVSFFQPTFFTVNSMPPAAADGEENLTDS